MSEQTVNGQKELKINVLKPEDETNTSRPSVGSQTEPDGNMIAAGVQMMKTLDANRYATKKTIAQGMLDIALLTANASQLKYILQVGHKHEFYTLMLSLIIISIVLQLAVALFFVAIGGLNINKQADHTAAIILNDVSAAILSVILATLTLHEDEKKNQIAWILNQIALGFVTAAMFADIIKMSFGLDPALAVNQTEIALNGILCVFLGSSLNINKNNDQDKANKVNNGCLAINIIIVTLNIVISAFDMREGLNIGDLIANLTNNAVQK